MGKGLVKGQSRPTVAVYPSTKDNLTDWLKNNNRPQMEAVVSKLIDWFIGQPPLVQMSILGHGDRHIAGALRELAGDMERKIGGPPLQAAIIHRDLTVEDAPVEIPMATRHAGTGSTPKRSRAR